MDVRRRIVLVDFGLAAAGVALGSAFTPRLSVGVAVLVALGVAVALAALALAELTDALALVDARRPESLVVAAAATLVVALALVLGRGVVPVPTGPMLVGSGVGLAAFRTVFGVRRPLPAARLAHVEVGWP